MLNKMFHNNHIQSAFAQIGTAVLAFVSFVILARWFTKSEFGIWIIYLTLITFLDMTKAGMVQTALIKYTSGASEREKKEFLGSSWLINLSLVGVIGVLCYSTLLLGFINWESINLFLFYYPIYSLVSMPFYYFNWVNQAAGNFRQITFIRLLNSSLFLFAVVARISFEYTIEDLISLHILVFTATSLFLVFSGKVVVKSVLFATKKSVKRIVAYGKYHALAFLGSNLLKSSDIMLIGFVLGPISVAIYSIPLRLIEIIEMPLKSCVQVAFPAFSKYDNQNKSTYLKEVVERYIGSLSILYIPFMFGLFFFSEHIVHLVGGDKYTNSVGIFRIFLVYGLFLPFDRLTGISLDAIGKPRINFYKVLVMALVNIVGDLAALYYFKSLELAAWVTVATVLTGMLVGFLMVKKHVGIDLKGILINGQNGLKMFVQNMVSKKNRI